MPIRCRLSDRFSSEYGVGSHSVYTVSSIATKTKLRASEPNQQLEPPVSTRKAKTIAQSLSDNQIARLLIESPDPSFLNVLEAEQHRRARCGVHFPTLAIAVLVILGAIFAATVAWDPSISASVQTGW